MRTAEEDRTQAEAQRDSDLLQEDLEKAWGRIKADLKWAQELYNLGLKEGFETFDNATEDDIKLIEWQLGIK